MNWFKAASQAARIFLSLPYLLALGCKWSSENMQTKHCSSVDSPLRQIISTTILCFMPCIFQCIKSRTICLRVKRRTGNKLGNHISLANFINNTNVAAEELAENSNVQDAFVIAVEQQARERLEKLSALRKIKPVDMTTLSQQVRRRTCIF